MSSKIEYKPFPNVMTGAGWTLHHAANMMINAGELRYKLLHESNIQVCRVSHGSNVVNKILNLKFMRRWESHSLVLSDSTLYSRTVSESGYEYISCFTPHGIGLSSTE